MVYLSEQPEEPIEHTQMLKRELDAHENENDATRQLRLGLESCPEQMPDPYTHGREGKGDDTDEKDGYGWSQSMRAIETEIRKCKDEINALKAFGNSEAEIKALRARIKTVRAKYNEIAEVTGISAEPKRMSVPK